MVWFSSAPSAVKLFSARDTGELFVDMLLDMRQVLGAATFGIAPQRAALLVPVAQHDALRGLAVELKVVHRRAMRVAVYQAQDVMIEHGLFDGLMIHIHDVVGLDAGLQTAL